jgi:RNA polymerase sigma-70 factor (sigma-E family)
MGRDTDFEALLDSMFERCAALGRRITGDRTAGEDLAAEAFARAWSRWPQLRADSRREGWVLRVTANLAIDASRRRRRLADPPPAVAPDDVAVIHVALIQALVALPRRQREAIALRYLADLPEADVATALGVTAGSVKTHLHRGLARLRGVLGTDDDTEVAHAFSR